MNIVIKGKTYNLPIFMPDATHASIKGVDSASLALAKVNGLVVNTYHLLNDDIVEVVKNSGGVKQFMNFDGLVITDSGGFQAMSLVRKNAKNGKFSDNGVFFKDYRSGKLINLTPEKCIETQLKLGSDIIMVLDDCTDPTEKLAQQEISVNRTLAWAKRCKVTFDTLTQDLPVESRPLIFAIIQGGNVKELRKKCADGLIEIGFDGYAYGGWPMQEGKMLTEILNYTCTLMPNNKPKYAMGVGKPKDILECFSMGYNMFDCVIPTRDARHGRFYVNSGLDTFNISKDIYVNDSTPIEDGCKCYTCQNYSKAYLRHLFKVKEPVYYKLASLHNLYVYSSLLEILSKR